MKWALASREAVLTNSLLEEQWKESLEEKLKELLKYCLSNLNYHQMEPWIPVLSRILHSVASNLISWRSIAEEQMSLARVDTFLKSFAPAIKLAFYALADSIQLPKKSALINFIVSITKLLYLANFMRTGEYHTPLLHLFGFKYVYYPRLSPGRMCSSPLEQLFCIYSTCKVIQEVTQCVKALRREYAMMKKPNMNKAFNCPLCLGERKETVCTPCGHCFCWTCLLQWMRTSPECPMCRRRSLLVNECCPVINL